MARLMLLRTWQVVPWLGLVEVDVADGRRGEAGVHGLPSEVAGDELFVRREEAGSARAAPAAPGRRRTRSAWERDGEKTDGSRPSSSPAQRGRERWVEDRK